MAKVSATVGVGEKPPLELSARLDCFHM